MKEEIKKELIGIVAAAEIEHRKVVGVVDVVADPDWAVWFADSLLEPINRLLNTELTQAELIYCLVKMRHEFDVLSTNEEWQEFIAGYLVSHFVTHDNSIEPKLALYMSPFCPFCMYVVAAIKMLGLDVEMRNVTTNQQFYDELLTARKRATVPVLRITCPDEELWLPESQDIVRYLNKIAK